MFRGIHVGSDGRLISWLPQRRPGRALGQAVVVFGFKLCSSVAVRLQAGDAGRCSEPDDASWPRVGFVVPNCTLALASWLHLTWRPVALGLPSFFRTPSCVCPLCVGV